MILKNQRKCLKESKTIITRPLTVENIKKINEELSQTNWDQELKEGTAEENFNRFHNTLCNIIETNAPEREKRISAKKVIQDPWITKGILQSLRNQRKLYTKMLGSKTEEALTKYRIHRNKLKSLIRKCKNKYLHDKCTEYKQDSRKLWQLINRMIKKENNKNQLIECIRVGPTLKYDPYNITNTFCEFFSTIGAKYAEKLESTPEEIQEYLNKIDNNTNSLFLHPCTDNEINTLIQELPQKTSSGFDNISNVLLKKISHSIIQPLCIIFNKSMEQGIFPSAMKKADITPLYKNKDQLECTNYRAISVLLTISKLLEKVI